MEQVQIHPQAAKALVALLTPSETARILGVRTDTLTVWRSTKRYPELKFIKVGRLVRYRPEDVERFLESRTIGAVEG